MCITGNGLKTIEVMDGQFSHVELIPAKIGDFDAMMVVMNEADELASAAANA